MAKSHNACQPCFRYSIVEASAVQEHAYGTDMLPSSQGLPYIPERVRRLSLRHADVNISVELGRTVVVLAIRFTMTSQLSSGRPRQFWGMWENRRCSTLFHLLVPGGKWHPGLSLSSLPGHPDLADRAWAN